MREVVRVRQTPSLCVLAAAFALLAPLLCSSRSESAEGTVTTNRLEHLDRFDPDTPREFDIPALPQPLAFKALARALYGSSYAEAGSPEEGDLVGPVKGVMSTREAWSIVAQGCTKVSITKVEVAKSYADFATDHGWYDYLDTPPAAATAKRHLSLPRLSRLDTVRVVAETYGVHINYMARTVEEEQELLEPFFLGNADLDLAVERITRGTYLEAQWLYDIATKQPMLSIEPASYRFSAQCPSPVVVVARRLYELDFGLPITISRREIELSGASNLPELLAHFSESGINKAAGSNAPGAQYVDLRGLGPEMFLVLLNGRRVMPSASDLNTPAFDIGSIPLPAVERIEIQVDTASTRHGSDAIAGVLNIVTNRKLIGPHAEVSYGSARGGAIERRATLGWGSKKKAWDVSAVLDTFASSGLLGRERDIWADQNYAARYGGTDYRSQFVARSATGEALPGSASSVAYLPSTPEPVSLFKYRSLVPEAERTSFVGNAEYSGARFTGSAEVLWLQKKNRYSYFPPIVAGVVPADSPNNPYDVPLIVSGLLSGRPSLEQHVDSELRRAVLGVRSRTKKWVFDVSGMTSRETAEAYIEGQLDPEGVARALAASEPSLSLDVFAQRPGAGIPADALAERHVDYLASDGDQLLVSAEGALFYWGPGNGNVRLNLGHEYRREAVQLENGGQARRYVQSSYAEASIPLIGASMEVPGIRSLNARAGIRSDSYRGASSIAKKQFSLEWDILDRLSFGFTHAEAYRPPSLYELRMPVVSFPTVVFDNRQNRAVPITFISGGNADLEAADGSSDTAYISYEPQDGLRLQARYFSVDVANHIALLPVETALQVEDLLPGRVVRAEPTPEERAAGLPGRLVSVDARKTNYGRLSTSGVDVALLRQFATRYGYWTARLSATWIDSYEFSALPIAGSPSVDRVGMADVRGSITRWRSVGSLGWSQGPWDVTTHVRFVPSYRDSEEDHEIGSQTIWDARFSYTLNNTISFTFGVRDILDTSPHFAFVGAATGWDWTQWDPVGRRWSLGMKISL